MPIIANELPLEILSKIDRLLWYSPLTASERAHLLRSWSITSRSWYQRLRLISTTDPWIQTPAQAKSFLECLIETSRCRASPNNSTNGAPEHRAGSESRDVQQMCRKLNFHIENPNLHNDLVSSFGEASRQHHLGHSRIFNNLLHNIILHNLLPNLEKITFRHLGYTIGETFFIVGMSSVRPPLLPGTTQLFYEWVFDDNRKAAIEDTLKQKVPTDFGFKHLTPKHYDHFVFYCASTERVQLDQINSLVSSGASGGSTDSDTSDSHLGVMEVLETTSVPEWFDPHLTVQELMALGTDGSRGTKDLFSQPQAHALTWDPNEEVDEDCIIS